MLSAAPWTIFLLLLALEAALVVLLRLGLAGTSALLHRHERAAAPPRATAEPASEEVGPAVLTPGHIG